MLRRVLIGIGEEWWGLMIDDEACLIALKLLFWKNEYNIQNLMKFGEK